MGPLRVFFPSSCSTFRRAVTRRIISRRRVVPQQQRAPHSPRNCAQLFPPPRSTDLTDGSNADKGPNLAAAAQYCGPQRGHRVSDGEVDGANL